MGDPRGKEYARESDEGKMFPCLKCYGTLDAPIETVCAFLADETLVGQYNDLIEDFRGK